MAGYISGRRLPWKRFWIPWDGKIRCGYDGRGFLDDPEDEWGKYSNPQVRSLDDLLLKRCLVLSGHPGIGKTVALETALEKLARELHAPDELFSFHCRYITSIEMLRAETVGHPRWRAARTANGNITLILDGVDEGLRKVPEFVGALAVMLRDESHQRLQVVLVCRSAEWDVAAGEQLMHLWQEIERGGVYELCPLRQLDAENAARAAGLDEQAFIKSVYRQRIQGLAARPITLKMLLEEFRTRHGFPKSARDLYARASWRMSGEVDEERVKSLRKHYTPPPQKHVHRVISRIAGALADSAPHLRRPAANLALADVLGDAVSIFNHFAEMVLAPRLISALAVLIGKLLPQLTGIMTGYIQVNPVAVGQFKTLSRTIRLSIPATGHGTTPHAFPVALKAHFFIWPRDREFRGRYEIRGRLGLNDGRRGLLPITEGQRQAKEECNRRAKCDGSRK